MLTTKQVSERLGLHYSSVMYLIKTGAIKAERFGKAWAIEEAEVERYRVERRPAHRPRKAPPADQP